MTNKKTRALIVCAIALLVGALVYITTSASPPKRFVELNELPTIYPDYVDVVVPKNIAPLNFYIEEPGDDYRTVVVDGDRALLCVAGRDVRFPEKKWKQILAQKGDGALKVDVYVKTSAQGWTRFKTFAFNVSKDPVDEWLSYRLIEPGYDYGGSICLAQRNLTTFDERVFFNANATRSCVNCHAFQNRETKNFMFHYRKGQKNPEGGTIFALDGKVQKITGKIESLSGSCSYPAWRPTGDLVAFSSNKTYQVFHTLSSQKIEVFDIESDLVLLNPGKNTARTITSTPNEFETFPSWSPDGKTLYYCSARAPAPQTGLNEKTRALDVAERIKEFRYDVYKREFDESTQTFSEPTLVVDASASGLSALFPRVSPDGRRLVYTVAESGTFPIWRPEAELWIKDLQTGEERPLDEINARGADSYHTWDSSGRWLVFSSRREDGQYTRPYFAHFDENGRASKPFVLPQRDPLANRRLFKSYNVPELTIEPIRVSNRALVDAAKSDPLATREESR